ncbi:hypothetical protein SAMN05216521_11153 [Enterocloster clostridioformis]|uniref:Uncharacterized protein n=1 Tax=Enterocloster clostridioformis TaxID=1531 RepID=A0A1I0KBA5_9FIRM|nr:hypothetical protein SAMN05216521_11153 [Enterocloster clostridioformis]SEW49502.1 hypothetical protein SAMN05216528_11123 [Enterocloster clostridioformis]
MPGEKIAEKMTSYLRKKQESKSSNTYEPLSDAHAGILTFFWKQRQTGGAGGRDLCVCEAGADRGSAGTVPCVR